tara:strand:- start:599 stop:883 length:285 start_codon:yes stop_codon:yes gene_type:complete
MEREHKKITFAKGGSLDSAFQDLDWRDTTDAYYKLDYTPFMQVVQEHYNLESIELDSAFQDLDWRDTTEAYYGLDYTPFMSAIEGLTKRKYSYK